MARRKGFANGVTGAVELNGQALVVTTYTDGQVYRQIGTDRVRGRLIEVLIIHACVRSQVTRYSFLVRHRQCYFSTVNLPRKFENARPNRSDDMDNFSIHSLDL